MFQKPILTHYLQQLDAQFVAEKFATFQKHFGNEPIQENYRVEKETALQGEFLRALFGDVLGYTLSPNPNFNLRREQKNELNAQEADGAVLVANTVRAVIELKDAKTPNLDKITDQAFGYHRNHSHCHYIITSNFQKLRFYIDKATSKIEFDLFHLTEDEFRLLYLCLSWNSIKSDLPQKMLAESITQETDITSRLYADYSVFKKRLFENLCQQNPQYDKLTLFKKTQKLLDRILFILFAEDRGLLRANEIERIVAEWKQLKKLRIAQPLYERFKQYFGFLNTGDSELGIFPYNGGLFQSDEVLDTIQMDDEILEQHARKLAAYDFASEVDVNILGHIFEHSLTEIEEITAELSGVAQTSQKSKRKKDGIFYTPKYITSYIVEQTLGKLCEAKRAEFGIDRMSEEPPPKKAAQKKALHWQLETYRNWLLQLKICDPACGSGAFLNQTLEFLIAQHKAIDELHTHIEHGKKDAVFTFADVETAILENNLYGVDINDESVEIARLSLWLRSAEKGRKLNDLSHRIKLGNSLVDDPSIAGDKAFDWRKEFPEVFSGNAAVPAAHTGNAAVSAALEERCRRDACVPVPGFDVIIGNPPYVRQETLDEAMKEYFQTHYSVYHGTADLYAYFIEKGISLLKDGGNYGVIVANKWLRANYGEPLRKWLKTWSMLEIVDFGDLPVFGKVTSYPMIFRVEKVRKNGKKMAISQVESLDFETLAEHLEGKRQLIDSDSLAPSGWQLRDEREKKLFDKLMSVGVSLKEYVGGKIYYGIKTGLNEAFVIDAATRQRLIQEDKRSQEIIKPFLAGRDIKRYAPLETEKYLIFARHGIVINDYPAIKAYLEQFRKQLTPKPKGWVSKDGKPWKGRAPGHYKWYELQTPINYYAEFEKPKIIFPDIAIRMQATYEAGKCFSGDTTFIFPIRDNFFLGLLNSKLLVFLFSNISATIRGGYLRYKRQYVERLPIYCINEKNKKEVAKRKEIVLLVERQLKQTAQLQKRRGQFLRRVSDNFSGVKISRVLEDFANLPFGDFLKEMAKQKYPIPLKWQDEWSEYFSSAQSECCRLQRELLATDKEIDRLVYELYGLTSAEIAVVEGTK